MLIPDLKEAKKRSNKEVLIKTNEYIIDNHLKDLGKGKKYFVKTYGCQMNEHDGENIKAILEDMSYIETDKMEDADVILLNTCAIRENAHNKVFGYLGRIKHLKEERPHVIAGICGCMKWYVFNDKEGNATVNVILDHNTTANVAYNSTGNNIEMKEVKKALENDTGTWENTARLITANEVAKITEKTGFDASKENQDWFCFDTNQSDSTNWCSKAQGTSKYAWLFDYTYECTSFGCNTSDSSTWGYWTSIPYKGNSAYAWRVNRGGHLYSTIVTNSGYGVRPVITISKSNI